MSKHWLSVLLAALLLACSPAEQKHIRLLSGDWDLALATSQLARAELERAGYAVTVEVVSPGQIWARLAAGEADASLSPWLPDGSRAHATRFFDRLHDLGPNGPPLRLGLAVPASAELSRVDELSGSGYGDNKIVGMMPGHGIMVLAEQALARYRLDEYQLLSGSGEAYRHLVDTAIEQQLPVVIAAWSPGSVMAGEGLKWLADEAGHFPRSERPHTLIRRGLEEHAPAAVEVLRRLRWSEAQLNELLALAGPERNYALAANKWLRLNPVPVD